MRWSLAAREAAAYVRMELSRPKRGQVHRDAGPHARRAITFVPGVGGHGAQFLGIQSCLESVADAFSAFEYSSRLHPEILARRLRERLEREARRGLELVIIGHSLGGVLGRIVLQNDAPLPLVSFVAICAPLGGTWRTRMFPQASLRALTPDSTLMQRVRRDAHRLERYRGRILTVGAGHDLLVRPARSAHFSGHPSYVFDDLTHNAALLDPRVHHLVGRFVRDCTST